MPKAQASQETTLQVTRILAAHREKVFRAWTDPAELSRWFAPSPDYTTAVPELDLRIGGTYRVEMHNKDGSVHRVRGTYQEIVVPEKLVFTWHWERPGSNDTLVTIEFHDLGASTEIVLTHERLADEADRNRHNHGWLGCLDQLAKFVG